MRCGTGRWSTSPATAVAQGDGLVADLRDRRGLPQLPATQRAQRPHPAGAAGGVEHAPVGGRGHAHPLRAGHGDAVGDEAAQERVGGPGGVRCRPGAVDDVVDRHDRAVGQHHLETAGDAARPDDLAAADDEVARGAHPPEGLAGGARHPVPQHVPARDVVREQLAPAVAAQPRPAARGERPHAVDDGPPVAAGPHDLGDPALDRRAQGRGVQVDVGRDVDRDRVDGAARVDARQQAAARDRPQPAPGAVQREGDVDHRQAGADQQHRSVTEGLQGAGRPRVGDEAGVVGQAGRHPARAGRLHAEGEDDGAGVEGRAVVEQQPRAAVAAGGERAGPLPVPAQRADGVGPARLGRQALGEVAPVEGAREEGVRVDRLARQGTGPPDEVVDVVGQRAQPPGRDVEQVPLVGGAVRDALPGARRVDQRHDGCVPAARSGRCAERPQQVQRGQRPGRAGAHDGDRHHVVVVYRPGRIHHLDRVVPASRGAIHRTGEPPGRPGAGPAGQTARTSWSPSRVTVTEASGWVAGSRRTDPSAASNWLPWLGQVRVSPSPASTVGALVGAPGVVGDELALRRLGHDVVVLAVGDDDGGAHRDVGRRHRDAAARPRGRAAVRLRARAGRAVVAESRR